MPDDAAWGLTETQHRDFLLMLESWRRNPKGPIVPPGSVQGDNRGDRPPIIVALLDPLERGQSVYGVVLTKRSTNSIQVVTAYGEVVGGEFRLGFKTSATADPEWTPFIDPLVDSAQVIQKYLSDLRSVGVGNVEVTLGLITTTDFVEHNLWRWEITFCGDFAGHDVEVLEVEDNLEGAGLIVLADNPLEDTGRLELIHEVLGVPNPSPLRAGARLIAVWHHGIGYIPVACEVRDFGDYGLFVR